MTLGGERVPLTSTEYRMLSELSAHSGGVVTYQRLLGRAWGANNDGDLRPMRTMMGKLRRKLGEDSEQPRYIFTEPRVGYRMPRGETDS
ncbi:MAG: helix-turn-helix domain-containing protein [Chloroflexi bacterium]|nr:helix-turn-helix domain-containing protein [Chloroflexota bacterium]MCY3697518.1 helix-turn-helix domain-containing protein [Chloroflexota bacterium]